MSGRRFADKLINKTDTTKADIGFWAGFQKACDLFQLALAVEFGFGYERQVRLSEAIKELDQKYGKAWICTDPESDWAQEQIDAVLKRACGDKFIPFRERNDCVQQETYGKKGKKGQR